MEPKDPVKRPALYRLMENPWILLALGVAIPTLSYTIWGWIELMNLPAATLP